MKKIISLAVLSLFLLSLFSASVFAVDELTHEDIYEGMDTFSRFNFELTKLFGAGTTFSALGETMGCDSYPDTVGSYIVDETYKFNSEDVTLEIWVYFVENRNMNEPPIYFGDNDNVPSLAIHKERSEGPSGSAGKLFAHNRYDQEGDIAWSAEGGETHVGHWIYLVGRFERGVETSLWINGQKEPDAANTCYNNNMNGASQFLARIGRAGIGGGSYMPNSAHIYLDEVRVSKNMARSGTWISTSYNNHDDPSSFLSIGPEVSVP